MKLMQTVALNDVRCFAYHGFYPEEQLIGNHFIVNIAAEYEANVFDDDLKNTINYEELNQILLQEMSKTQKLLETVLKNIITQIVDTYSFVHKVSVRINKLHPPMPGQVGSSMVQLSYQR